MNALTIHTHVRIDVPTPRQDIRQYYARLYRLARLYYADNQPDQFMQEFGNAGVFSRVTVARILYSVESR